MLSLLRSERLHTAGFAHAFSTRAGGVSAAPFDSLNMGRAVGDDPSAVDENHRRFLAAVGVDRLFVVSQVHGADAQVVEPTDRAEDIAKVRADAIVGARGCGAMLGVRIADCTPVLLGDPVTGAAAAVHVGWRGAVARVLDRAIDAMARRSGARTRELIAAIGPHIRGAAFEVGEDVAAQIAAQAHGRAVILSGYSKPHVDLAATVIGQLEALGVSKDRIDDVGGCTFTETERFFSFRRDGQRSGRLLAAIAPLG